MNKFAKLFEVMDRQVLVLRQYDPEKNEDLLVIMTEIEEESQVMAIAFKTEEARDKAFDEYDVEKAEKYIKSLL